MYMLDKPKNSLIQICLIIIFATFIFALLLSGCTGIDSLPKSTQSSQLPKIDRQSDNTVSLTSEAQSSDSAVSVPTYAIPDGLGNDDIPLIFSPDGASLYIMQRNAGYSLLRGKTNGVTLKGETRIMVELVRLDISSMKRQVIAKDIPFISYVKWNFDSTKIAFCGGNKMTVYDSRENKLLLADSLKNDAISYFGWSPDGETIYTEHPSLLNGSIISLADSKLTHCYENDVRLYYKGTLDSNKISADRSLYFATLVLPVDEKEQKEKGGNITTEATVIVAADGKIQKELPSGRFRGSSGKGFLQIGSKNFGLTFYPDIDYPGKAISLTEQYVYDTRFLPDGSFLFITSSGDVYKNEFILHFADARGSEITSTIISGSSLSVSPDGKTGYVSSLGGEIINLDTVRQKGSLKDTIKWADNNAGSTPAATEVLYTAIRGAMDVYYKNEILGVHDMNEVGKYFTDSKGPEQCALFDIATLLKERKIFHNADFYNLDLTLEKLDIKSDRASAKIYGGCGNSFGSGMGVGESLELIQKDGRWYVTGLSTFPNSTQCQEVKAKIPGIISDISKGKLFEGVLKGREITAGQIQFWQMSSPHYAENIDYANFCKVYLNVKDNNVEVTYKLILDKKNYKTWTPVNLTKDNLSGL